MASAVQQRAVEARTGPDPGLQQEPAALEGAGSAVHGEGPRGSRRGPVLFGRWDIVPWKTLKRHEEDVKKSPAPERSCFRPSVRSARRPASRWPVRGVADMQWPSLERTVPDDGADGSPVPQRDRASVSPSRVGRAHACHGLFCSTLLFCRLFSRLPTRY